MADINLGVGGANSATGGYEIDNSVKLEADNDERFTRTPSSAGNRKTWTFSAWVKRTELGANQILISAADTYLYFGSDDKIHCNFRPASENFFLSTNRLFRDTSAWYHIVVQCDTTDSTAADRAKLYINGVRETSYSNSTYNNMSQNLDTSMNNTIEHMIGRYSSSDDYRMSGYISEFHLVDGTALTPTSFGEYDDDSGIWKPKEYTGSYGTNGFYLDFADAADLGDDESGNGNDWTEVNLTAADQATDTPTNNFCTLNILDQRTDTPSITTEGATVNVQDPGSGTGAVRGTMGVNSGKWYWEFQLDLFEGAFYYLYGVSSLEKTNARYPGQGDGGFSIGVYAQGGNAYFNGTNTAWETSGVGADGDIIGIFMDLDNETLKVQKNGTFIGNVNNDIMALTGISANFNKKDYTAAFADGTNSTAYRTRFLVNFGGYCAYTISSGNSDANGYGNFEYSPNDGTYDYLSLCTKNLAEYG